jgi:L-rhamnose isomerase/sugar isomerase
MRSSHDVCIAEQNASRKAALDDDYTALGDQLARRGVDIEQLTTRAMTFQVAVPSWGVGTGGVSLHFPWDRPEGRPAELAAAIRARGLHVDSTNSNTFQDHPGQHLSYKFGSLTHTDAAVRRQAIEHNLECLQFARALDASAHTVWIGDGSNFAGQQHLRRALDRYLASLREIYAALPDGCSLLLEHKLYEPAMYSTVISDASWVLGRCRWWTSVITPPT